MMSCFVIFPTIGELSNEKNQVCIIVFQTIEKQWSPKIFLSDYPDLLKLDKPQQTLLVLNSDYLD